MGSDQSSLQLLWTKGLPVLCCDAFCEDEILDIYAYKDDPRISGDLVFWRKVLTGELLKGYKIRLINFQVSPWFPRKPGTYWTHDAAQARREALRHVEKRGNDYVVFDVWGKTLMTELGGIGSVNIRKDRNTVLFTLTASGETDQGIPVVCSPMIWESISRVLEQDQPIELDVKGTIRSLPIQYDAYLLRSAGIPKVAVHIDSILNLKLKRSVSYIIVYPRTIFRTRHKDKPFGFTYVTHDLMNDSYDRSAEWIQDYVEEHGGTTILTDFDEETNCLNSMFPLQDCLNGAIAEEDIVRFCQGRPGI